MYVVTGGGRGIGRAIVQRLAANHQVAVIEFDPDALSWANGHPAITPIIGDARDEAVTERAAKAVAPLRGWVNNAAIFRDEGASRSAGWAWPTRSPRWWRSCCPTRRHS